MPKLIHCLLLLLPGFLLGQFDRSLDLTVGADYTHRHLRAGDDDPTLAKTIQNRNDGELGKYNWHLGVHYNRRVSGRLFLKTGLQLASVGYRDERLTDLRWGSEYTDGKWIKDPSLPHELEVRRNYWFVEVPLVARYAITSGRLTPYVELGVAPSLYLNSRTRSITDLGDDTEVTRDDTPKIRDVQLVALFGCGVSYRLSDGFAVFAQPSLRYHLTAMVGSPVRERLYGVGLGVGVRWGL